MLTNLIPSLPWSFLFIQDLIGTVVFAITGVIAARQHNMDMFGMFVLGFVTGVGGGTLRDVMIGATPVFWMQQPIYVLMAMLAVGITLLFRHQFDSNWKTGLLIFDAIGLGVFTVIGAEKGLAFGLHPLICIALGAVTGCFGGLIRDVLRNKVPAILRKEMYVTSSLIGATLFILCRSVGEIQSNWLDVITILTVITTRLLTVRFNWHLPRI